MGFFHWIETVCKHLLNTLSHWIIGKPVFDRVRKITPHRRMPGEQKRIFLWAVPRSISTAFLRAMLHHSSTKVLLEPFSRAYYNGPDRKSSRYLSDPVKPEWTYEAIKAEIEAPCPGYETVFVKDMSYYLSGRLDTPASLPDGYIHTFLLRDPEKSIYSLYKMSLNTQLTGWDRFDPAEAGYKELYETFKLVTERLQQPAIVIDADDLLKDPETMLRLYCGKVGLEFEDSMINWEDTPQSMEMFKAFLVESACLNQLDIFKEWLPWFEGVLGTTSFKPSDTKPKSPLVTPDLPRHVQRAIADSNVFYREMHARRLKPNTLQ